MKNIKVIKPVVCLCCGKELKSLCEDDYEMVDGGVVDHVYMPYGSDRDGDVFQIAICDGCIAKKEKDGKIILKGDYMYDSVTNHKNKIVKLSNYCYD